MRVRLLGSMELEGDDGLPLSVRGTKLRAVLAMLALDAGRVVATDRLIEDLWQDDPPTGVTNALQGLVSKLRKALGSPDLVVMRPPGYVLTIEPEHVDVHRLQALAVVAREAASAGDSHRALQHFVAAEDLWRGPALADFAYDEFARPHITRLEELRLSLIEQRVELELALGRDTELVSELEALVADHPLRERLRAQLMLALYRAGRQADALRSYQDGRRVLADELGLEPGPDLQQLEAAILGQEATLLVDVARVSGAATPVPSRTNLKAPLTPLVGRDREVHEVSELLSQARLVTVVGAGGAGKTRLALEAARATEEQWQGVFVVELAPVREPGQVADAVAAALELPGPADTPLERTRRYCSGRRLLLVLDNCEHVIDAAASFAEELLSTCADVRVLATSREALRLPDETVWPIPPLTASDARELFACRATAVDPSFTTDDETWVLIDDICTRLDGLPLAIELAAARTRVFSVAQIAERLDDRFRLLTGGSRTAMARQQTLRAVVQWSYDLLFRDEQLLFDRLSVFAGGCLIDAAEAVCGIAPLERDDIEDLVAALVQKSLLTVDRRGPQPRYRMLQTLSQYGREQLVERGEADEILGRLSAYFADACARGREAFQGRDQRRWHHTMHSEQDNISTAFDWAIGSGNKDRALSIAADLGLHRWVTGTVREGHRWLETAFAMPGPATPFAEGWALLWRAFLGYLSGHVDDVDTYFDKSIELLGTEAGPMFVAYAMSFQAQILAETGRVERGAAINEAALEVIRPAGDDPWVRAFRTWLRAVLAVQRGDVASFETWLREALPELRSAGDEFMTAVCLDLVAEFDDATGDVDAAITHRCAALEIVRGLRMVRFEAAVLALLGRTELRAGNVGLAEPHLQEALVRASELGALPVRALALNALADLRRRAGSLDDSEQAALEAHDLYAAAGPRFSSLFSRGTAPSDVPLGRAASASVLGYLAEARGEPARAIEFHRESFRRAQLAGHRQAIALALEGLAAATVASEDALRAARLLGAADQLRDDRNATRTPSELADADRVRFRTQTLLGDRFANEIEIGRRTRPEDLALPDGDD